MTGFLYKIKRTYAMSFLNKDKKLLEQYESIWNKISNITEREIYKKPNQL